MDKDLKNSINYITQKMGKKSGFSVPEKYFDEIENNAITNIFAEQLPKSTNLNVPTNYFSTLEDSILSKIASEEKNTNVISLRSKFFSFVPYVAAASVLLFLGFYLFNNLNNTNINELDFANIEDWYENGYIDTNDSDLALALEMTDFEEDEITSINFNDDNVENYLNSIDNTTIFNETP